MAEAIESKEEILTDSSIITLPRRLAFSDEEWGESFMYFDYMFKEDTHDISVERIKDTLDIDVSPDNVNDDIEEFFFDEEDVVFAEQGVKNNTRATMQKLTGICSTCFKAISKRIRISLPFVIFISTTILVALLAYLTYGLYEGYMNQREPTTVEKVELYLTETYRSIFGFFRRIVDSVLGALDYVYGVVSYIFSPVTYAFGILFNAIDSTFETVFGLLGLNYEIVREVGRSIRNTFLGVLQTVYAYVSNFFGAIAYVFGTVFGLLAYGVGSTVGNVFELGAQMIASAFGLFRYILHSIFGGWYQSLEDAVSYTCDGIRNAIYIFFASILSAFSLLFEGVFNVFAYVFGSTITFIGRIFGRILQVFGDIFNAILDFIRYLGNIW